MELELATWLWETYPIHPMQAQEAARRLMDGIEGAMENGVVQGIDLASHAKNIVIRPR